MRVPHGPVHAFSHAFALSDTGSAANGQRCTTGMPDEYSSLDHVMADEVVGPVAGWIALRVMG